MITFSPIQKLIQETLFKKMKMLDKTPPIEINEPSSDDGYKETKKILENLDK